MSSARFALLAFFLTLPLAACSLNAEAIARDFGIAHAAGDAAPVVIPRDTPTPFPFPTEIPSPTRPVIPPTRAVIPEALFTPTPVPPPCVETQGTVISASIPSETLNYPIDAQIYLPPCYGHDLTQHYPVLYLIHGLNFTNTQWVRLGMPYYADFLIAGHDIAPLIIVMPSDRRDDRLDPALVTDLVPYIDENYRTLADRRFRAIGGLSRGAGWAIHFGLHYPELFGRVGAHSPAIFIGDEENILEWLRASPPEIFPVFYFDIGEDDGQPQSAFWFDQVLTWFKIEHTYIRQPGNHSEEYWAEHVPEYLLFYAADWREANPPTPTPEAP
jgi:enterochelin esterase-like enzyme